MKIRAAYACTNVQLLLLFENYFPVKVLGTTKRYKCVKNILMINCPWCLGFPFDSYQETTYPSLKLSIIYVTYYKMSKFLHVEDTD